MASGALFGIAAQISLQRLGLDFDSIRGDVLAHRTATPHFALAWWAWWLVALGAFFVGPLCVAATRAIVIGCRLMPGLGSFATAFATAIVALGLAAVAQPRSFPPAAAVATNVVVSLLMVIGSTVLALLGAQLLGNRDRTATPLGFRLGGRLHHLQGSAPFPAIALRREGSANSGLPLLRTQLRHPLVHRSFSGARAALVAQLAVLVCAPVSVLAGSSVLLHLSAAGPVRAGDPSRTALADTARETRSRRQIPLPTDEDGVTVPAATEAPAGPGHVELPAPRQPEIPTAIGHRPALSESELTFTKGYPQRRAAQLAAGMISQPAIPQRTSARTPRSAAASRPRIRKYVHVHYRYAAFKREHGEWQW
jgi:hypothetical protein